MAKVRTFIAVLLTADLKNRIKVIQEQFKNVAPQVKWVAEENFHVTLKFLGDVESDRHDEIYAALDTAVAEADAFTIGVAGAGAFPSPRRPQVVWIGLKSGVEPLVSLAAKVESELERIGFPRENRKFSAHITIGRARPDRPVGDLPKTLQEADIGEIGEVHVSSIAVMKSDLRREGPEYSVLKEIGLRVEG